MSPSGQNRKCSRLHGTSVLPSRVDIVRSPWHVCLVPFPDPAERSYKVSMRPQSGQRASLSAEALVEYGYSLVILAGPGGGQSLCCKLDERLDQRRNVSAARIHGIKPANRRRVVAENAAQPPFPDRRLGDVVGQLSDAVACNRCGNHRLHFIGGEASRNRDRFLPMRPVPHPVSAAGRWARNDAVMASEGRRRYRDAAASEGVRASRQSTDVEAPTCGAAPYALSDFLPPI